MAYALRGKLLEVCTCKILCPCWVGEDPDGERGDCLSVNSWHIDQGTAFSTIPGAPAYVSKAEYYRAKEPRLGFDLDLRGHNAIEGEFTFLAQG